MRRIASRFLVGASFVTRLLHRHRTAGPVEPRPHGGGNPAVLGPEDLERPRRSIREQPDTTLRECRQRPGLSSSLMTISRAPKNSGLPRKKKVPRAQERDRPEVQGQRREFRERLAGVDPERLVFAALRGDGDVGVPVCHQYRRIRGLREGGAGAGIEAR